MASGTTQKLHRASLIAHRCNFSGEKKLPYFRLSLLYKKKHFNFNIFTVFLAKKNKNQLQQSISSGTEVHNQHQHSDNVTPRRPNPNCAARPAGADAEGTAALCITPSAAA